MKAVINLNNLVIDTKHLDLLEEILDSAERQDYDYAANKCNYYIRPIPIEGFSINLIPNDLYEAQKLVWKLKQDSESCGNSSRTVKKTT